MRVPDWMVYLVVLAVVVGVLFSRGGGEDTMPDRPDIAGLPPGAPGPDEPRGPAIPDPHPMDEKVLVQIGEVSDGIGTAFAVNRSGVWLTARHVVDGCQAVGLAIGDGRLVRVEEVITSGVSDLALLTTSRAPVAMAIDLERELHVGDVGFHVGFPQGKPGEAASRLQSRSRLVTRGRYDLDEPVLAWTEIARSGGIPDTLAGMSGGPVFDDDGTIIGVTVAESPRRGRIYTASPESVARFLDRHGVTTSVDGGQPLSVDTLGDVADDMRDALGVVEVVCDGDGR
jgi:serine protease Do